MMVPGFSGHLVTGSYVAARVAPVANPHAEAARGALTHACRRTFAELGPASSLRALTEAAFIPLLAALGFGRCDGFEITRTLLVGAARCGTGSIVLAAAAPWGDRLDGHWREIIVEAQRRSASWALLFNGTHLRILDVDRLYLRRSVDIDLAVAGECESTMAALERLAGCRALTAPSSDPLSLRALVADSDRDAAVVCRSLKDGVLTASEEVFRALAGRRPRSSGQAAQAAFDQALIIVYRIVFLLFAEARALVPLWHPVYRESYSVESLRELAERSRHARGLWDALRAMARLAHAGCRAGDLQVTPFNGRLFAPARTPLAERRDLDDGAAKRAVLALATRPSADGRGRERIAYADLGVEQLGAVYETLLDYRPDHTSRGGLVSGSGLRKTTGTFYTPQAIADCLVRRTLAPLVHGRTAQAILELRIVDPAMGSGACLVAACRFLAAAFEQALVAEGAAHPGDIDERERASIRRRIVEQCLYGVDLNPMAVQLARLSLWLASLAADRPLSFLDHRLAVGDSLLGAWLSALRRPPTRRRAAVDPLPLFEDAAAAAAIVHALPIRFSLESVPNDTIEQVREKEEAFATLTGHAGALRQWKRIADLWCAAWFADPPALPANAFGALADAILSGSGALPPHVAKSCLDTATAIASAKRFFHWELEFPEVFFDAGGGRLTRPGFDAVIGNPPWDMMRADAGDPDARDRARADVTATVRFTRDAGVYDAQSDGHANRYQLFADRAMALTRSGGRLGLVLPWGLAADHGSSALRRNLFNRCSVDAIVGIDNHRAIFPIHRSVRFLLLTATAGPPTDAIACRFGVDSSAALEQIGESDAAQSIRLTRPAVERLSGSSLAIPYLRTPLDLAIAEKAAALFPPLGAGKWNVHFGRELNATDDRAAFGPPGNGLPVVEGKLLEPFRVGVDGAAASISPAAARRRLGPDRFDRPRLAYRDVAGATNRQTLIAAILPAGTVSTHTVFCLRTGLPLHEQHLLCGLFNSFVVNYLVRLRVGTHVTTAIVEQLPIPRPAVAPAAGREIAALARCLSRGTNTARLARLNALAARLYQLTRTEFEHVVSTFPLVAEADRRAALEQFAQLM
jgi:hypothetical protein